MHQLKTHSARINLIFFSQRLPRLLPYTVDYKESPVSSKNMETSLWSINWPKLWDYKEFRTVARVVDFVLFTTVTSSSQ